MRRPSFQFYPADWRTDVPLRLAGLEARGLWMDLLCLMHDAKPYGHLPLGEEGLNWEPLQGVSQPWIESYAKGLAPLIGESAEVIAQPLFDLVRRRVCSVTDDGVIFSRRMVADEELRSTRAAGGYLAENNPNASVRGDVRGGGRQPHNGVNGKTPSRGTPRGSGGNPPSSSSASSSSNTHTAVSEGAEAPPYRRAKPTLPRNPLQFNLEECGRQLMGLMEEVGYALPGPRGILKHAMENVERVAAERHIDFEAARDVIADSLRAYLESPHGKSEQRYEAYLWFYREHYRDNRALWQQTRSKAEPEKPVWEQERGPHKRTMKGLPMDGEDDAFYAEKRDLRKPHADLTAEQLASRKSLWQERQLKWWGEILFTDDEYEQACVAGKMKR